MCSTQAGPLRFAEECAVLGEEHATLGAAPLRFRERPSQPALDSPEFFGRDPGLGALLAAAVAAEPHLAHQQSGAYARLRSLAGHGQLTMVLQPIIDLSVKQVAGAEALARFELRPERSPSSWFRDADRAGLGAALQLLAAQRGVEVASAVPTGRFISLNVDVDVIVRPELQAIAEHSPRPVVLELTGNVDIDDHAALRRALVQLRRFGVRLAIHERRAGRLGLSRIVQLAPEIIKLDVDLVRHVDHDPVRRGLAASAVDFADSTGAEVIATGIETREELLTVSELGVRYGQGHLLGRPMPAASFALQHGATGPRRINF